VAKCNKSLVNKMIAVAIKKSDLSATNKKELYCTNQYIAQMIATRFSNFYTTNFYTTNPLAAQLI
jgi:hypothetical protein